MKHIPLRCIPAALLAAALLAGCGAKTAPPASVAVKPAESKQPAALTATPHRTGQHDGTGKGAGTRKR